MHRLIGEMVAVDLQPISVVEDIGFIRLVNETCPNYNIRSRRFIKDKIITDKYTKMKGNIQYDIQQAKFISFTTDGWTASTSNTSFLSLTGHWITEDFNQNSAILRVVPFPSSHTAANISACLTETINEFKIPTHKVHTIVRDR